jgi:hypothetical protein
LAENVVQAGSPAADDIKREESVDLRPSTTNGVQCPESKARNMMVDEPFRIPKS